MKKSHIVTAAVVVLLVGLFILANRVDMMSIHKLIHGG